MKILSQLFLLYLITIMAFPPHGMDHCEHEETSIELTHHEHDSHDHPDGNCCPPFSNCKHCSTFAPLSIHPSWTIATSAFLIENHPIIPSFTITDRIHHFWHPPKFA
ncbi:hypothetical protein [Mongoliitalea daihaiensis]|uniref:hypothetical protein n=1 Tax=Mongoliitalea daihaiensis TaxID=2782006 RepID=UPI001F183B60|nr:hypothetical protein [Mongoliitalea daihaiensis]UJP66017.1 hypothetical protein IPZ59_05180 [Mongoliitalea daihaiensis]